MNQTKAELLKQIATLQKQLEQPTLKRRKLPDTHHGITHKFQVGDTEGYISTQHYPDGSLGGFFLNVQKEGSTLGGVLDSFAIQVSLAIQFGVPLESIVKHMKHQRYAPYGITNNPQIKEAESITDYIGKWLSIHYLKQST